MVLTFTNLSMTLEKGMPVYPGDPELDFEQHLDISKCGFGYNIIHFPEHCGTHVDAPNHQNLDDPRGVEAWDHPKFKSNFMYFIDLSNAPEAQEFGGIKYLLKVTDEHLKPHIDKMKGRGAILIRTGYDKFLEARKKHVEGEIPYLTKEAAGLLAKLDNINVIGIDSLTIDETGKKDSNGKSIPVQDAHHALTKKKMVIESLVNLHRLNKSRLYKLISEPVIIKGATGAPVTILAGAEISHHC